jgi:hypothetical protein
MRRHLALNPDLKMNAEGLYDLVMAETGDEAAAQKAVHDDLLARQLKNEPVE